MIRKLWYFFHLIGDHHTWLAAKGPNNSIRMYVIVLVALILCILFKVLNVNNSPEKSLFYCANGKLLEQIMKSAPQLAEPYKPTRESNHSILNSVEWAKGIKLFKYKTFPIPCRSLGFQRSHPDDPARRDKSAELPPGGWAQTFHQSS